MPIVRISSAVASNSALWSSWCDDLIAVEDHSAVVQRADHETEALLILPPASFESPISPSWRSGSFPSRLNSALRRKHVARQPFQTSHLPNCLRPLLLRTYPEAHVDAGVRRTPP